MGLIKAGIGAVGGTLADQWKEFFYCEAIPKDVSAFFKALNISYENIS